MENCLVAKLKKSIDNDDLRTEGSFLINFVGGNNGTAILQPSLLAGEELVFRLIGNGHFSDSTFTQNLGKEIVTPVSVNDPTGKDYYMYVVATEDCVVEVSGIPYGRVMYGVMLTDYCYMDFNDYVKYWYPRFILSGASNNSVTKSTVDLANIARPDLIAQFMLAKGITNGSGNISKFENCSSLQKIGLSWSIRFFGNLTSLHGCTALTYLAFNDSAVEGSLTALAEAWANAGKTGSCGIYLSGSNVLLNNKKVVNSMTMTIVSASNITLASGGTTYATFNGVSWTYSGGYE